MRAPIVEPEVELHARPGQVGGGLPDIAVLVGRRVVLQGAAPAVTVVSMASVVPLALQDTVVTRG